MESTTQHLHEEKQEQMLRGENGYSVERDAGDVKVGAKRGRRVRCQCVR